MGAEGLAPQPRRKPRMPNQTPPELEAKILEMTEQYPTYSYIRISQSAPADRHRCFAFGGALRLAAARPGGALSAPVVAGAQGRGLARC